MNTPDAIDERKAVLQHIKERNAVIKELWKSKAIGNEAAQLWLCEAELLATFIASRRNAHAKALATTGGQP